jgi:hypothetical protein
LQDWRQLWNAEIFAVFDLVGDATEGILIHI